MEGGQDSWRACLYDGVACVCTLALSTFTRVERSTEILSEEAICACKVFCAVNDFGCSNLCRLFYAQFKEAI